MECCCLGPLQYLDHDIIHWESTSVVQMAESYIDTLVQLISCSQRARSWSLHTQRPHPLATADVTIRKVSRSGDTLWSVSRHSLAATQYSSPTASAADLEALRCRLVGQSI